MKQTVQVIRITMSVTGDSIEDINSLENDSRKLFKWFFGQPNDRK